MTHTTRILRTLAVPTLLVAVLAVASCGTSSGEHSGAGNDKVSSSSPAAGAKNEVDVDFATMMIPHHAQAIEMADLALKQATAPEVKDLASTIKGAQGPEVDRMSGWLTGWGEPVPGAGGGHDMSGSDGPTDGMMSDQEMTDLGEASGSGFDRMWLQMMARHHEGAVDMAKTQLSKGANLESKKLAQGILDSQSSEITQMNVILSGIAG